MTRVQSSADVLVRYVTKSMQLPFTPLQDIHVRPGVAAICLLLLGVMAVLGFHPTVGSHLPAHSDKALHFLTFGTATFLLYWVLDVPDEASRRRKWLWRHFAGIVTGTTCTAAGIASEFVQAALPYKSFQTGDIAANLLGVAGGLYGSIRLDRYRRQRAEEISHLYLSADDDDDEDDEDDEGGQRADLHV